MDVKNEFVVYTALFGNYDDLIDPKERYEGCDFICFTDRKDLKSDVWKIRVVENIDLSPNLMNRKYKILPHLYLSDYEQSLYVDSNIKILKNPLELCNKYLIKYNLVLPKHFERKCIYKEAKECIVLGRTKLKEVEKQILKYKTNKFPLNFGLAENNIILRNHNNKVIVRIMNEWWQELINETKRDQLSLAYILWKNNLKFNFMEETSRNKNEYFKYEMHKCDKNISFLEKIKIKIAIFYRKNLVFLRYKI